MAKGAKWMSPDAELVKALNHPLRRRILHRALDDGAVFSPRQLAAEWEESLSNLSYHIRVLAELEALILTATKPVRGSMQHFYMRSSRADQPWVRLMLGMDAPAS